MDQFLIELTMLNIKHNVSIIRMLKKHGVPALYHMLGNKDNPEKIFFLRSATDNERDPLYTSLTNSGKKRICIMSKNPIPKGQSNKFLTKFLNNKLVSNSLDPKYIPHVADGLHKLQKLLSDTNLN